MPLPEFVNQRSSWPDLPLAAWEPTLRTLHMWTQVVGKVRLALSPHVNHWWEVPLYVSAQGLTTSPIPYSRGIFEMEFDFIRHRLMFRTSSGEEANLRLQPRTVAEFYREVMGTLASLGIQAQIWTTPVEIPNPIRFEQDTQNATYDGEYANRWWRALVIADAIFKHFRAEFTGKVSPVHFFWGSFDLAVTRFSGRPAPEREGADAITREAYSHEVISVGLWPGGGDIQGPAFYAYAAPEPGGYSSAKVEPSTAFYHPEMKEFLLHYEDARKEQAPADAVLRFCQSTYDAGARLAGWNLPSLGRETTSRS